MCDLTVVVRDSIAVRIWRSAWRKGAGGGAITGGGGIKPCTPAGRCGIELKLPRGGAAAPACGDGPDAPPPDNSELNIQEFSRFVWLQELLNYAYQPSPPVHWIILNLKNFLKSRVIAAL